MSGRNAIPWDGRFALDMRSVDEHDLRTLDIIVRTFKIGLERESVNATSDESMPEFMGKDAPAPSEEASP